MNLEWSSAPPDRDPGTTAIGLRCLVGGEIREWRGASAPVDSPVYQPGPSGLVPRRLGLCAQPDAALAREALTAAVRAYDRGRGTWPTASVAERIGCLEKFLDRMQSKRLEVARLITWEIAKPWADSLKEFDRTVAYTRDTIRALKEIDHVSASFAIDSGFLAQIRRSPYGVALCMGPYNYPVNELLTILLPALVMGNTAIAKLPRIGMLCNLPLLEAFAESFPPGVVSVLSGDGTTVVTPLMESGQIDLLAFVGSSRVANLLLQQHPRPNRLRSVLGLGTKNPAIVLADADEALAAEECLRGALTFNGQRCTSLMQIFVHRSIAESFAGRLAAGMSGLKSGMPFVDEVALTPLPEGDTVRKMTRLVEDAVSKGATVLNPGGASTDRTYFHPAVLYPIRPGMALWTEEQFGPIVAIAPFDAVSEPLDWLADSPYGQQASLFGRDPAVVGPLIDALVNQVCRVNLNGQCQRGPDTFPFGGRKDSAEGTLSVTDALRVFSIRTLAAAKSIPANQELLQGILRGRHSRFLTTEYLF